MGDIYRPKEGERVRVVYEGVAHDPDDIGLSIREEGKDTVPILWTDAGLISVEKLEPPVEVFKPGDVVRHRISGGWFLIGPDGYFSFRYKEYRRRGPEYLALTFTSTDYERVPLS